MSDWTALDDWIEAATRDGVACYAKRLSGDETWANGSRDDGFRIPARWFLKLFPRFDSQQTGSNSQCVTIEVASCPSVGEAAKSCRCTLVASTVWPELDVRIGGLGGASSPLLDPENTGALVVFASQIARGLTEQSCSVWVCRTVAEEELLEHWLGPVDPGQTVLWSRSEGTTLAA